MESFVSYDESRREHPTDMSAEGVYEQTISGAAERANGQTSSSSLT